MLSHGKLLLRCGRSPKQRAPEATVSGLLSAVGCAAPALNLYTLAASAAFSLMSVRNVAIFRSSSSTPACSDHNAKLRQPILQIVPAGGYGSGLLLHQVSI